MPWLKCWWASNEVRDRSYHSKGMHKSWNCFQSWWLFLWTKAMTILLSFLSTYFVWKKISIFIVLFFCFIIIINSHIHRISFIIQINHVFDNKILFKIIKILNLIRKKYKKKTGIVNQTAEWKTEKGSYWRYPSLPAGNARTNPSGFQSLWRNCRYFCPDGIWSGWRPGHWRPVP